MATQQFTGVIDRFEENLAVILLEADGEVVEEVLVECAEVPDEASEVDAVLEVSLTDGEVTDLSYDATETAERRERAQSRFDRLAERPPDEDGLE